MTSSDCLIYSIWTGLSLYFKSRPEFGIFSFWEKKFPGKMLKLRKKKSQIFTKDGKFHVFAELCFTTEEKQFIMCLIGTRKLNLSFCLIENYLCFMRIYSEIESRYIK